MRATADELTGRGLVARHHEKTGESFGAETCGNIGTIAARHIILITFSCLGLAEQAGFV